MQLRTKAQIFLICYMSATVLVPVNPSPYTFFIDTVGSLVSLASLGFIFFFYFASVPSWQRTCIQGISQLLLVWLALVVIRAYFASLMVNVLHNTTQKLLMKYPTLSCILFSGRITFVPTLVSLLLLEMSRLGLLLFTIRFQSMNHDMVVYACIAFTVGVSLMDLLLSFTTKYVNYCIYMSRFAKVNKFQLSSDDPEENSSSGSPIPAVSLSILAIEIAYQVISYYRKLKVNKVDVLPNPIQVQESTASTSTQTNGIVRLAPSLNPEARKMPCKRHSSFSLPVKEKTNFRRFSLDSLRADNSVKKVESHVQSLQLNSCTGRLLITDTTAPKKPTQHVTINVGSPAPKAEKKSKCNTFTLTLISIQSMFVIWTIINGYNKHTDSIIGKILEVVYSFLMRFVKYCIGLYWIYESEKLTEFTITKSKQFLLKIFSSNVWPIAIQNLANRFQ